MGQHKIDGASQGPGYKKHQGMISRFVTAHVPGKHRKGSTFKMMDGRKYVVDQGGSFRRA